MKISAIADTYLWEGEGAISNRNLLPNELDRTPSTVGNASVVVDDESVAAVEQNPDCTEHSEQQKSRLSLNPFRRRRRQNGVQQQGIQQQQSKLRRSRLAPVSVTNSATTINPPAVIDPMQDQFSPPSPCFSVRSTRADVTGEILLKKQKPLVRLSARQGEPCQHGYDQDNDDDSNDGVSISPSINQAMSNARLIRKMSTLSMDSTPQIARTADFGDPMLRLQMKEEIAVESDGDDNESTRRDITTASPGDIVFTPQLHSDLVLTHYVEPPQDGIAACTSNPRKLLERPDRMTKRASTDGTFPRGRVERPERICKRASTDGVYLNANKSILARPKPVASMQATTIVEDSNERAVANSAPPSHLDVKQSLKPSLARPQTIDKSATTTGEYGSEYTKNLASPIRRAVRTEQFGKEHAIYNSPKSDVREGASLARHTPPPPNARRLGLEEDAILVGPSREIHGPLKAPERNVSIKLAPTIGPSKKVSYCEESPASLRMMKSQNDIVFKPDTLASDRQQRRRQSDSA